MDVADPIAWRGVIAIRQTLLLQPSNSSPRLSRRHRQSCYAVEQWVWLSKCWANPSKRSGSTGARFAIDIAEGNEESVSPMLLHTTAPVDCGVLLEARDLLRARLRPRRQHAARNVEAASAKRFPRCPRNIDGNRAPVEPVRFEGWPSTSTAKPQLFNQRSSFVGVSATKGGDCLKAQQKRLPNRDDARQAIDSATSIATVKSNNGEPARIPVRSRCAVMARSSPNPDLPFSRANLAAAKRQKTRGNIYCGKSAQFGQRFSDEVSRVRSHRQSEGIAKGGAAFARTAGSVTLRESV